MLLCLFVRPFRRLPHVVRSMQHLLRLLERALNLGNVVLSVLDRIAVHKRLLRTSAWWHTGLLPGSQVRLATPPAAASGVARLRSTECLYSSGRASD